MVSMERTYNNQKLRTKEIYNLNFDLRARYSMAKNVAYFRLDTRQKHLWVCGKCMLISKEYSLCWCDSSPSIHSSMQHTSSAERACRVRDVAKLGKARAQCLVGGLRADTLQKQRRGGSRRLRRVRSRLVVSRWSIGRRLGSVRRVGRVVRLRSDGGRIVVRVRARRSAVRSRSTIPIATATTAISAIIVIAAATAAIVTATTASRKPAATTSAAASADAAATTMRR